MSLQVFADGEALAQAAAHYVIERCRDTLKQSDRFTWVLSGGSTPKRTYEILAQPELAAQIDWSQVQIFWGDERCVPTDDQNSNQRMTRDALLAHIPIPSQNIHGMPYNDDPNAMAEVFETDLRHFFGDVLPVFDLVFLGLGDNGHTASLFPETPVLDETHRWAATVTIPGQEFAVHRVTLTVPVLNHARQIVFLVSGSAKADVLPQILYGPHQPSHLPAQLIHPTTGNMLWMVDEAAAKNLTITAL